MLRITRSRRLTAAALALLLFLTTLLSGCVDLDIQFPWTEVTSPVDIDELTILNGDRLTMQEGEHLQLRTNADVDGAHLLRWEASNACATVSDLGYVMAQKAGKVTITVTLGHLKDSVFIEIRRTSETTAATDPTPGTTPVDPPETDPLPDDPTETAPPPASDLVIPEAQGSPAGYRPAANRQEALDRSGRGELSGYIYVPNQAPLLSANRPQKNGMYIRNNQPYYADQDTYVVVDANGREVLRVYRGGGYITLEEVAAYVYAFGDVPANYVSGKNVSPSDSIWGEYLRLNHSKFSGDTSRYPYEPELPNISGCGGTYQYYEIDIGTTGTDCDPSYPIREYNTGTYITRGAARIVYARFDRNGNKIIDPDEKYVFYTYNHYNDFREYLNYYGGWGDMFGNITGGGTLSSKWDYNPTDYIPTCPAALTSNGARILPTLSLAPRTAVPTAAVPATYLDCLTFYDAGACRRHRYGDRNRVA